MEFLTFLNQNLTVAVILAGILGLLVGSFLNVVIYRLPVMMEREWKQQCAELNAEADGNSDDGSDQKHKTSSSTQIDDEPTFNLAVPRSSCPHCQHAITAVENIPVISYLLLRGKCSSCKTPISIRYPIIEAISGLLSAYIVFTYGVDFSSVLLMLFTWVLICLTMIDYDHQLLPDSLTLPLLWLGLIANSFGLFTDLPTALWGAIAGYMVLWIVYWAFKLLTGKEGMGYGDFKLLAALGAWMGWQMLPLIIILSSLVGAFVGIALSIVAGRDSAKPIPFGPFLATAGFIAMLWGESLVNEYWQLIGM